VGGSLQTVNNLLFFMSNIWLIVAREFNERVRKKSFIVTTLLMPVLMLGLMLAPALMMRYASGQTKTIVVIDRSGLVAQHLESSDEVRFETSDLPVDTARRVMIDKFGVLYIGADVLTNPSDVKLYANSASSMMLEENLRGQIAKVLEREKLRAYRIEDLDRILADVKTDVKMQVVRNDEGSPSSGSSAVAAMVGLGLGMVLYMFLLIYGAMVMQSVIEEKSSRVLEVVVSSVRPFELMMGKIFGVASVAVVQVLIWASAGLRCGCGGHAPCAARRRDGGCRGLAAGRRCGDSRGGRFRSRNARRHRPGYRRGLSGDAVRLPAALCRGRLSALFGDVRGRRVGGRQRTGRRAVADADRSPRGRSWPRATPSPRTRRRAARARGRSPTSGCRRECAPHRTPRSCRRRS